LTSTGGIFNNAMARQSLTLNGIVSNLTDTFFGFGRALLGMDSEGNIRQGGAFYYLAQGGQKLLDVVGQIDGAKIADNLINMIRPVFNFITSNTPESQAVLIGLASVAGTLLVGAFVSMTIAVIGATWPFILLGATAGGLFYLFQTNLPVFYGVATAIGVIAEIILSSYVPAMWASATATIAATWPILAVGLAVGSAVFALVWLYQNWDFVMNGIKNISGSVWQWIQSNWFNVLINALYVMAGPLGWLLGAWNNNLFGMRDTAYRVKDAIVGAFNGIKDSVSNSVSSTWNGVINSFRDKLNGFRNMINPIIWKIRSIPGVPWIDEIPAFATGGIVGGNSTSGDKILARVNSGELILNRGQQDRLASQLTNNTVSNENNSNMTFNFNFSGSYLGTERDRRDLITELEQAIKSKFPQLQTN
jgi:hypothetical protein